MGVTVRSADETSPYPTIVCGTCGGQAALNLFDPVPQQVREFLALHRHRLEERTVTSADGR